MLTLCRLRGSALCLALLGCASQVLDLGEDVPIFDSGSGGASGEPLCETGATRCNSAMLELCVQGEAWLSLQNCGAPELCTSGGPELSAYCSPPNDPLCELGTTRCNGQVLQLCTDEGTAWVDWQVCTAAAPCATRGTGAGTTACWTL